MSRCVHLLAAGALPALTLALVACPGPDPTYVGVCVPEACPAPPNATPACDAGACSFSCEEAFLDCNGVPGDGCEADTTRDADHCGACGSPCPFGCDESQCVVPVDVSVGAENACAVLSDGTLWCWGRNQYGEHGRDDGVHATPVQVELAGAAIGVSVGGKVGTGHVCAVMADGTVQCWGDGNLNGNPTVNGAVVAPAPVTGLVNVVQVSAGGRHTCARQEDGDLFCWGANFNGELGNGEVLSGDNYEDAAIQVFTDAVDVAAGDDHSCAATSQGDVRCWGDNSFGQLGTGDGMDATTPTSVLSGGVEVAAGTRSTCARVDDEVYCWGRDLNGAVGEGTCALEVPTPTLITVASPEGLTVGAEVSAAISGAAATLVSWGAGPFPDGSSATPPDSCVPAAKGLEGVVKVDLGADVGCAIVRDDRLVCWGDDGFGGVGDGDPAGGMTGAVDIAIPR